MVVDEEAGTVEKEVEDGLEAEAEAEDGCGRGRAFAKVRKDVKLPEGQPDLGFQWRHVGDGNAPRLTSVARSSFVGSVAKVGDCLLRVNGLDMAMMTEKQITDLLKQRPLELRFGDE